MIDQYLADLQAKGKSIHTISSYTKHLDKFSNWLELQGLDYTQVNGKESKAFRNYLVSLGLAPKTVNCILGAVKSFYNFLCEEGMVKGNPIIMRRLRVAEPKHNPDFLTDDELAKVKSAMDKLPYHIKLAFMTMLHAGLRVSEVANLSPDDVFVDNNSVFVKVRHGKGNKDRIAPVTDVIVAKDLIELAKNRYNQAKLFGVSAGTLKVYAYNIKKISGVNFHCHRMRHTLATKLLAQGQPIDVVQKVLGHVDISTTRRYAETMPEAIYKVAAKIT